MFRSHRQKYSQAPKKRGDISSLKKNGPRIIAAIKPYSAVLALGFVALIGASGINLLFPYLLKEILNESFGISLHYDINKIVLALIGLFALQSVLFFIRHYCFQLVGYSYVCDLRKKLFRSTLFQDVEFFDTSKTGDLLSRLSSDTEVVQRSVTSNVSVAIRYIIQVLGGIGLMLYISPSLTLLVIMLIPIIVVGSAFWGMRLRKLSHLMQERFGQASAAAEEAVSGIRTVKLFGALDYETDNYNKSIDSALEAGKKRARVAASFSSTMVFLVHASIAGVIWFGARQLLNQTLSAGDLTAFLLYCVIVAVSFGFLSSVWEEFMHAVGAAERIFAIIDQKPEIRPPQAPEPVPDVVAASVEFKNVSFSYPSRPDVLVLDNVTLNIEAGQTIALVGPSGAGKSTIASLIPRFYDPKEGDVLYSGVSIKKFDAEDLRKSISMVSQDPHIFSVSIKENILYGRPDATKDEVISAAKAAYIHEFVLTLPDAYDTLVGERGITLSGGQKQRLAIARALLRNPKLLILDEATSSLDSENEHLVQQALERLIHGRTSLVIAHRLSTVKHADVVVVLKDGKLHQIGTHQSLVNEPGLYQTLVEHQLIQ